MLVKIPNEFIRRKVVEQEIWHIGTSMFYVAQWSAQLAMKTPTMDSIPLWAHVQGVSFDLYTREGLSLVAGNIGDPVEADELTIRMVSLDVTHLKVRANCTKPLPPVVELIRDNGSIIPVSVTYPWIPPTCPSCNCLGHLEQRCPNAKWAPSAKDSSTASGHAKDSSSKSAPVNRSEHGTSASHDNPAPSSSKNQGKDPINSSSRSSQDAAAPSRVSVSLTTDCITLTAGVPEMVISNQSSQVDVPPSSAIIYLEVGLPAAKPYINVSSKKRKGSPLSRRSSPESIGGSFSANLFSDISMANPFALLEPRNLGHLSSTAFSFSSKEPNGILSESTTISATVPSFEESTTPVKGSSPPGGRNTKNI